MPGDWEAYVAVAGDSALDEAKNAPRYAWPDCEETLPGDMPMSLRTRA